MKQIASMILALIFTASCSDGGQQLQSISIKEDLSKSVVYAYEVGQDLDLSFEWQKSLPVVYFSGLNKHHTVTARLENQKLIVHIPWHITAKSGIYHIKSLRENIIYQLAEIHLSAAQIDGKITSYLGPKSIINDGAQESEITAFPIDSLRNPTGRNSSIDLNIIDDASESSEILNLTDNFITRKFTSEKGNSLIVGVSSDQAFSEGNQIRTLSLCPVKINLYKEDNSFLADGHQFFKVRTDFLVDKNGQQIADGTIASLRVLDKNTNEVAEYKAYSVNGIVSCWIQNPSLEGRYDIEIKICDVKEIIPLGQFSGLVAAFEYRWKKDEIVIGPVTNTLGQFVPDGSPVSISIEGESLEQTVEKHIVDGYARFALDDFWLKNIPSKGLLELNNRFYKIQSLSI